jgi:YfiH family protein
METEFIKNKVYYKIIDRTYTNSSGEYSFHRCDNDVKLAQVRQNINNIKTEFKADELFLMNQVHSNDVVLADDKTDFRKQPIADASVTTQKNIALCVLTADCVPVLFASVDGSVIAAAHCGWKSAKANIIANVQKMMQAQGAKKIKAIIGPTIAQKSYEVDKNYYLDFLKEGDNIKELFVPSIRENHFMFDLSGFVKKKLEAENIELVHNIGEDTYSMPEKYPSYRRACHEGMQYLGNILSTIIIK